MKKPHPFGIIILILALFSGCQPVEVPPTAAPQSLPTVTVGKRVEAALPPAGSNVFGAPVSNPGTAVALISQPTAQPDLRSCPATSPQVTLPAQPTDGDDSNRAVLAFLNEGGTVEALRQSMLSQWNALSDAAYFRTDIDLTGEAVPEVVIGYSTPQGRGTLLIVGCLEGRYVQHYTAISDTPEPPSLLYLGEMNNTVPPEVAFARPDCDELGEDCEFITQVVGWSAEVGRFVNLVSETIASIDLPVIRDSDDDLILEIVINRNNNGNPRTGPQRTGISIYDWNSTVYVLSIEQLNEPRFRIQVIHEADEDFSRLRMEDAVRLYDLALDAENNLRYWYNDGRIVTLTYAYYRRILAHAYLGNDGEVLATLAALNEAYPQDDRGLNFSPVYVHLANVFVETYGQNVDLHASCDAVRAVMADRPSALTLLNRYGTRNPTYTTLDVCPY